MTTPVGEIQPTVEPVALNTPTAISETQQSVLIPRIPNNYMLFSSTSILLSGLLVFLIIKKRITF